MSFRICLDHLVKEEEAARFYGLICIDVKDLEVLNIFLCFTAKVRLLRCRKI